jgi:(2Fe-2S) ferredoxin
MSKIDLKSIKENTQASCECCVKIGMSTCGLAAGAEEVFKVFETEIKKRKLPLTVRKCGCIGLCCAEPLVEVNVKELPKVLYGNVDKKIALKIIEEHIEKKNLIHDYIYEINM